MGFMSRSSGIPRWLKKLLLTLSTVGAAAATFVLMRREGDRLAELRDSSVEALKGRFSGKVVPRVGGDGDLAEVATFPAKAARARKDPEPRRCAATTTSGKRCSREVGLDEEYCWQHGPG